VLPEDLKYKQERLNNIKTAKKALEQREALLNPGKEIEDKKTNQLCRYGCPYHEQEKRF